MKEENFIDTAEIAKSLGVSRFTILRLIRDGKLSCCVKIRGQWRCRLSEVVKELRADGEHE